MTKLLVLSSVIVLACISFTSAADPPKAARPNFKAKTPQEKAEHARWLAERQALARQQGLKDRQKSAQSLAEYRLQQAERARIQATPEYQRYQAQKRQAYLDQQAAYRAQIETQSKMQADAARAQADLMRAQGMQALGAAALRDADTYRQQMLLNRQRAGYSIPGTNPYTGAPLPTVVPVPVTLPGVNVPIP